MIPVNTKSLFHTLCRTMERLESAEIDAAQASAMSKLVGQATNLLNYEIKRAEMMARPEVAEFHRNLESKNFDSL